MTRNIFIFLSTFVAGALIALVARAAMFNPDTSHEGHAAGGGDYAPMVSNPLVPATTAVSKSASPATATTTKTGPAEPHANHGPAAAKTSKPNPPVNTVCAICGMDVDPKIPTMEYQGKTIGFGCKLCPPKFKADPDRYGPLYLKNESLKR